MTAALRRLIIDNRGAGMRLDQFVVRNLPGSQAPGLSRSRIQKLIGSGKITINGQKAKASARLKADDLVQIQADPPRPAELEAEAVPLEILYEDADCLVINKSAGMIVHPAAGNLHGTLVNAVLHHCSDLQGIGGEQRPGIVHRLDKDTSGAIVIAKNDLAFHALAQQFKDRSVEKEYLALVWGKLAAERGGIDRAIGRHRSNRKKMSSLYPGKKARAAITEWQVEKIYGADKGCAVSWVRIRPRTGRTHQIRVHFADMGHPVVGDRVYGRRKSGKANGSPAEVRLHRQALHAHRLTFLHPRTGARITAEAPLPQDISALLERLSFK